MATDKIANLELEAKQGRGESHAVSSVRLDPPSTVAFRRKEVRGAPVNGSLFLDIFLHLPPVRIN
jgi:hypothetical protein